MNIKLKKNQLKKILLAIFLIGIVKLTYSQSTDIWSGNYIIKSTASTIMDTIQIKKTADADKNEVAGKYLSNLSRWVITAKEDDSKTKMIAREFLYDIENNRDEYKQFGWADLYKKEQITCLSVGHFIICKTTPNNTILIDNQSFFTKTGLFGIRLHYGLFELEKYE